VLSYILSANEASSSIEKDYWPISGTVFSEEDGFRLESKMIFSGAEENNRPEGSEVDGG